MRTVYYSVAENPQAISDVYLVRVVLDRSGRRIWFGKIAEKSRATWQLASIRGALGSKNAGGKRNTGNTCERDRALKYFNYEKES